MSEIYIALSKGEIGCLSPEDQDLAALKWWSGVHGYATRNTYTRCPTSNRRITKANFLHRIVGERMFGDLDYPRKVIEHIDGDVTNNTRSNLRLITQCQSHQSRAGASRNSETKVRGVFYNKAIDMYQAQVMANGERHTLGPFTSVKEARNAVRQKRRELCGEFAGGD